MVKPKRKKVVDDARRALNAVYGNADNPTELREEFGFPTADVKDDETKGVMGPLPDVHSEIATDLGAWKMLNEDAQARAQIAERNREQAEAQKRSAMQLASQLQERVKKEEAKNAALLYNTEKAKVNIASNDAVNQEVNQLKDVRMKLQNELDAERLRRLYTYPNDAVAVARYLDKEKIKKEVKQELDEEKKLKRAATKAVKVKVVHVRARSPVKKKSRSSSKTKRKPKRK